MVLNIIKILAFMPVYVNLHRSPKGACQAGANRATIGMPALRLTCLAIKISGKEKLNRGG